MPVESHNASSTQDLKARTFFLPDPILGIYNSSREQIGFPAIPMEVQYAD
jgi:hypothetical protein